MIFSKLAAPLAAILAVATAQRPATPQSTEVIDGIKFIKSGPRVLLPKDEYELKFARDALNRLKTRLGPDGLLDLLQPDIQEADAFWHDIIDKSSSSLYVSADGRVIGFFPNMTALDFAAWSQSPLADKANNAANPEHYFKRTEEVSPGVLRAEILEGWGGVTTHFTVPDYTTPPDKEKHGMLRELPEFPIQAAGSKVLADGTDAVFGVLHISVRDVPGEEHGEEQDGIEVYASVWYGDAIDDDHLEAERQHIVVEIINMSMQAQKDIENGDFKPPTAQ
ncbi:hypothetical protein ACRE_067080 [Hapsidospora chrysogenum ATCC 11550]|uniref:Uncharacterized protein n=1 Tax=Hapsidospora chrysogenum (strain ATCC 11550 / CBS 779.69 / DSM 880 / IAM 14645 / JCM 23072 / IMI 49137) TaxID=857340 RepID=A0A086SZM7_HAPC1|nr:hypothetical protein ACRE_067080 [Hapsidospora chrysogenum ATCC 11550]